jgi:hypothetical protein
MDRSIILRSIVGFQLIALIAFVIFMIYYSWGVIFKKQGFVAQFGDYPDSVSTITHVEGALQFPGVSDVPELPGPVGISSI